MALGPAPPSLALSVQSYAIPTDKGHSSALLQHNVQKEDRRVERPEALEGFVSDVMGPQLHPFGSGPIFFYSPGNSHAEHISLHRSVSVT